LQLGLSPGRSEATKLMAAPQAKCIKSANTAQKQNP